MLTRTSSSVAEGKRDETSQRGVGFAVSVCVSVAWRLRSRGWLPAPGCNTGEAVTNLSSTHTQGPILNPIPSWPLHPIPARSLILYTSISVYARTVYTYIHHSDERARRTWKILQGGEIPPFRHPSTSNMRHPQTIYTAAAAADVVARDEIYLEKSVCEF